MKSLRAAAIFPLVLALAAPLLAAVPMPSAFVDTLALQEEVEPNGGPASATPIGASPTVLFAQITPAVDADWFSFTAAAGDRIYASTMTEGAAELGRDTILDLYATNGSTLLETDDQDGDYTAFSSSIAGFPIPAGGTYYLRVTDKGNNGLITPYHMHFVRRSGSPGVEAEPNDTTPTAQPLPPSGWVAGGLSSNGDIDWYSLTLGAGDTLSLAGDIDPERNGSWDARLHFAYLDADGELISNSSTMSLPTPLSEVFYMTVKDAGAYYVGISWSTGVAPSTYHLSASVMPPQLLPGCVSFPSGGTPVVIGPATTTSTVTVASGLLVGDLNVAIDLECTEMADLDVTLTSPLGTVVPLWADIGSVARPIMDLVLDDEAAIPAGVHTVNAGVVYQPENATAGGGRLWGFDGESATGTWTLTITDDTANGSSGDLLGWSLEICAAAPRIVVTPEDGLVTTEAAGTATFAASLTTQPTGDVVVALTSSDISEGTVSPSSLTFTAGDWSQPHVVTITGADDASPDGNISYTIVTGPATSSDGDYSGRDAADVGVVNNDDETSGFSKLQVLLPGETAAPGTPTGKSGTPAPQAAGVPFNVTVNAVDATWNLVNTIGDTVRLTSTDANASMPVDAALASGTATFPVTLVTAGSRTITASDVSDTSKTPNTSSSITLGAGAFVKLQILVPGETAAPGTPTGKTGTPNATTAGAAFSVIVNAVDDNWNRVITATDVVHLASTDGSAVLGADGALAAGTRTIAGVEFRTPGSWTITASDVTDGGKFPDTTPPINVTLGAFSKLQVLLPGETAAPGTSTGKTGTPTAQAAAVPFNVTVNAVDANWYLISSVTDTVRITSNDAYALLPADAALAGGTQTFAVTLRAAGTTRTVTATDVSPPAVTPGTSSNLVVAAGPFVRLQLLVPGETAAPGSASGKTGTPSIQRSGVPLSVTVNAVDDLWNRVTTVTDTVALSTTDTSAIVAAAAALSGGTRSFSNGIEFRTPGQWTVTATDLTDGSKPPSTSPPIDVILGAFVKLQILVPGETAAPGTATGKTGTPSAQVAGVPFDVTVNSVDSEWYPIPSTDTVHIVSSDANAVLPADAALVGGTASFAVTLRSAGGRTVRASDVTDPGKTPNTSGSIVVLANTYTRLQVLVPGEAAAPGSATGKTGAPSPQQIGGPFTVTVNGVDDYWNRITTATDVVHLTSTDGTATLPADAALAGGTRAMTVTLRTIGTWTVTASDMTAPPVASGTSASVSVINGPLNRLIVLYPGESLAPGTPSGKTGTALQQVAGVPFTITVRGTTAYYYPVDSATDTIRITASDPYAVLPPDAALVGGVRTFSVELREAGPNRSITASDITDTVVFPDTANVLVQPAAFSKLQVLLPGQSPEPGSPSGRIGTPLPQLVGEPFSVWVIAVDDFWNRIFSVYDVVTLSSNDPAATLAVPESLQAGDASLSVQFGSVGTWTITASYSPDQAAFTFFPTDTYNWAIGSGPDGNVWYTTEFGGASTVVGNITSAGVVTEYSVPTTQFPSLPAITGGPDGNMWLMAQNGNIGRMATDGTGLTVFSVPASLNDITPGPDGNLWFTTSRGHRIGRITPAGAIFLFTIAGVAPTDINNPNGITTGADGKLWYCAADSVERVEIDGTSLQHFENVEATGIVAGPDSAMWTSDYSAGMARIAGGVVTTYPGMFYGGRTVESAYGQLWAVHSANRIVQRDVNGSVRAIHHLPLSGVPRPRDSTVAADGSVWFTMYSHPTTLGRLVPTTGVGAGPDTSTPVGVALGPFDRLQILLPGESAAPGTTTGKTGTPTPQTAGVPFSVTVNAVTGSWYSSPGVTDTVHIASSDAYAVLPPDASLVNSTGTFQVTLRAAGTGTVTASDVTSGGITADTSTVAVNTAAFTKLQILAPGEVAAPGSATGKTGTPTTRTVSAPFNVTVNAVDDFWNRITTVTDVVHITSTDGAATLPADAALVAGTRTRSVELQTVGTWTVTASDVTDGTKLPNTSAGIPVAVGVFTKLQTLLPGETAAPGTPTGKTGTALAQTAGVPFDITVNAVDANWYGVPGVTDTVHLTSTDANATLAGDAAMVGGTQTFQVTLRSGGTTRTVTASDVNSPTKTPSTSSPITLNANAFTRMQLLVPGETAAPGSPTGKTGTPANQNISTNFNVTVRAVDDYWNVVPSVIDTVHLTSDEPTATIPVDADLVAGTRTFAGFRFNQTGSWTITASNLDDAGKPPSTSPPITITTGTFTKLQILVPGETPVPGTPTGKTGTPLPQTAGVPFDVIVNAVDANWYVLGNVGDTVHLASTDANATLAADTALNGGTVTLSVTLNTAGTRTITASDMTAPIQTSNTTPNITVGTGPVTKLQLIVPGETAAPGTPTGKTGAPTARLAGASFTVVVNAVDDLWNRVTSITHTVRFSSTDGAAVLPIEQALVAGTRTYTNLTEFRTPGLWTLTAEDFTEPAVTANTSPDISVTLGPLNKLQILVPGETAAPGTTTGKTGTPLPQQAGVPFNVTVNAVDANWYLIAATGDTVRLTSSDTNAVLPGDTPLAGGTATLQVTMRTSGTRTVTASDITNVGITANTSSSITVATGACTKLQILVPGETAAPGTSTGKTGTPTTRNVGAAFSIIVNAVDDNWNRVTSVTDTVGITSSDATAVLPANLALVAGTRTFTTFEFRTIGTWTVTANDITTPARASDTSPAILVALGPATKLQVLLPGETAAPGTATGKTGTADLQTAGVAFPITVNAVDANWYLIDTVGDNVAITSSDPYAVLPAPALLVNGTQSFSVVLRKGGTRTVTATDVSNVAIAANTSSNITVGASVFTKLQILVPGETADTGSATGKTGTPSPRTAGAAFSVTVNAVDDYWNRVTTVTDIVAITTTSPLSFLPANQALAAGTRTYTTVELRSAGSWTMTATDFTDGTKTPDTSPAISVVLGPFSKLQVLLPGETADPGTTTGKSGTPSPQVAGVPFDFTVNAVDAYWNLINNVTDEVNITSSDLNAVPPANAFLVGGTQTFTITLRTGGTRTITADDVSPGTITSNTSSNLSVVAGPAIKLQILVPGETAAPGTPAGKIGDPTARLSGVPFNIIVNAVDDLWNRNTAVTDIVALTTTDATAFVPANAALAAGTRTFTTFEFRSPGNYTITVSDIGDPAKLPNTSPPIPVDIGAFTKLQILLPGETAAPGTTSGKTGTPSAQVAGVPFNFVVNAVDANWNVVGSVGDTVAITSTDLHAILPANTALVSGTQTLSMQFRNAGTRTVTASDFSDPTKTPSTSPSVTVGTNTFTQLQILVPGETADPGSATGKIGTPNPLVAATNFSVTVRAVDDYWNRITNATDTVHLDSTDANDVMPADAALAAGTRTFTTLQLKTAGSWTITASDVTDANKQPNTSPPIAVSAGAFAKLLVIVPGETAAPGTATGKTGTPSQQTRGIAFDVDVYGVDANWNANAAAGDVVHLVASSAGGTMPLDTPLTGGVVTLSVTLVADGSLTASDVTDASKTPYTTPVIDVVSTCDASVGDLNLAGGVSAVDLVIMANYLVGNVAPGTPPFTAPLAAADANANGIVDATDLVLLANFLVGNVSCLPV